MTNMLKSRGVQRVAGQCFARYFQFVAATSRMQNEMAPLVETVRPHLPAIFTFWHGEQFLIPTVVTGAIPFAVLVSRHGDGEIQAAAMEVFGVPTIRGSGGRNRAKTLKKGGIQGSLEILSALNENVNIGMTANVPRGPARRVGKGVVTLGKLSGRPIFPIAHVTNRNWVLKSWDMAAINMPFSKAAFTVGKPIYVAQDATDNEVEVARQTLEDELFAVNHRAREMVGIVEKGG